jgi:TolA-binding protein
MSEPFDPIDALRQLPAAARRQPCPEEERWIELLTGRLDAAEQERLRQHLEECPSCAATARDARQFLVAMGELADPRRVTQRSRLLVLAAAVALAVVGTAVLLKTGVGRRPAPDPVAELAATLDVAAPAEADAGSVDSELVFRGEGGSERVSSFAAALAPYRSRDYPSACAALALHGRRFPEDREARYLGAVACLKAGKVDRAEALLAALAAAPGDRRDDARSLLGRLRRARGGPGG